jgi:hypothetical protein
MLGIILIVAGLLGVIYGGFSYTRERTVVDLGSVVAKIDEKKSVSIPPVAGGVAIVAGVVMVLASRRRVTV